ncbi:hypothetical protein Aperf_G00000128432 [Anoplocephala perfoliata]
MLLLLPIRNLEENLPDFKEDSISGIDFLIFRFYFQQTHAYLSQSTTSCEVVAQERNPFSCEIEWQWIPHSKYNATLLRNLATGNYLCFDDEGKPVAVKHPKLERCLLRAFPPKFDYVKRTNDIQMCKGGLFQGIESEFFAAIFSAIQSQAVNYGSLRPKHNGVQYRLPAAVHLKSLLDDRSWYVGFCTNGHAFANDNPYREDCSNIYLPKWWNVVELCPPIPQHCWIQECMPNNEIPKSGVACPEDCVSSIRCR